MSPTEVIETPIPN